MHLSDILQEKSVVYHADLHSKKQILQHISDLLCEQTPWLNNKHVFNCLLERERLGSTALGHGVAIPHCRSDNIKEPLACLLSLQESVDFNSVDNQPVDLVFGLIVPEDNHKQHLQLLSEIAEMLDNENLRKELSNASNAEELFTLIKKAQEKKS